MLLGSRPDDLQSKFGLLITLSKTEWRPSSRTMFCCTIDPSRTCDGRN
jgi:hypothetical protein